MLGFHEVACVAPNYDSLMALAMSPDAFVACTRSVVTSVSMLDFVDIQQYICSNMLAFSLLEPPFLFSFWLIATLVLTLSLLNGA
jgi:hypothetical protein